MSSTIAKSAKVAPDAQIEAPIHVGPGCLVLARAVGRYTFINSNTLIYQHVRIGRFVSIARDCHIGGAEHPLENLTTSFFRVSRNWFPDDELAQTLPRVPNTNRRDAPEGGQIAIGHDVWIGAKSVIMGGVSIGNGAVVGAGSIVTRDVPPYAIVAGNPARLIRYRFPADVIAALQELAWWDRDMELIGRLPFDRVAECIEMLRAP